MNNRRFLTMKRMTEKISRTEKEEPKLQHFKTEDETFVMTNSLFDL